MLWLGFKSHSTSIGIDYIVKYFVGLNENGAPIGCEELYVEDDHLIWHCNNFTTLLQDSVSLPTKNIIHSVLH